MMLAPKGNLLSTISYDVGTQREFTINHFINCQTTFVIYRLECTECEVFYIGRTKRRLLDRLTEHKYAIRTGNTKLSHGKTLYGKPQ